MLTNKLVEMTDGMTGADVAAVVNAAGMSAIKEQVSTKNGTKKLKISMKHFESALEKIKAGSSRTKMRNFQNFLGSSRSLT